MLFNGSEGKKGEKGRHRAGDVRYQSEQVKGKVGARLPFAYIFFLTVGERRKKEKKIEER